MLLVIGPQLEAKGVRPFDRVAAGHGDLLAVDALVHVGRRVRQFAQQGLDQQFALLVHAHLADAVVGDGDAPGISARHHDQVIFQRPILGRVVAHIDARVDITVPHFLEAAHVGGLAVAHEVVRYLGVGIAALGAHRGIAAHEAQLPRMAAAAPGELARRTSLALLLLDREAVRNALVDLHGVEGRHHHALGRGHRLTVGEVRPEEHAGAELPLVLREVDLLIVDVQEGIDVRMPMVMAMLQRGHGGLWQLG